jgi:hypothetical protein
MNQEMAETCSTAIRYVSERFMGWPRATPHPAPRPPKSATT